MDLGGTPADDLAATPAELDAVLPPTWSGANPVDIVGDADASRYAAALEVLLADPENDAVLVLNVQTAIASAARYRRDGDRIVAKYREQHRSWAKPVLASGSAADQNIIETSSTAPAFRTIRPKTTPCAASCTS